MEASKFIYGWQKSDSEHPPLGRCLGTKQASLQPAREAFWVVYFTFVRVSYPQNGATHAPVV